MTVQASDGGMPPRSQQIKVTVTISTDKNLPSFDKTDYTAEMTEDQEVGAIVIKVSASDKDVSINLVYLCLFSSLDTVWQASVTGRGRVEGRGETGEERESA